MDPDSFDFSLVEELTPEEQSNYRYIINIPGHACAYRLSLELSMGSVIFLVESKYTLWFHKYLQPGVHYIPIKSDLSNLLQQIDWAQQHDKECQTIAKNSLKFYNKFLKKDGIFDYLQSMCTHIAAVSGLPFVYRQQTEFCQNIPTPTCSTAPAIESTTPQPTPLVTLLVSNDPNQATGCCRRQARHNQLALGHVAGFQRNQKRPAAAAGKRRCRCVTKHGSVA